MINRRDTTRLLFGGAAAAALPLPANAASREEWVAAMQQALTKATRPGGSTKLTLAKFGFGKRGHRVAMSAVVRMDWPPGYRSRRFEARGEGENAVFRELLAEVIGEYRRANPNGVV